MSDDPPEDQPGEEDQSGAEQIGDERRHFVGHHRYRRQHLVETERAERGDQPDQPHQPIGQPPQFLADAVAADPRVALQDRHFVDHPRHRPLHRLGDEMGDDQNQDREQHPGAPQHQLVAPISGGLGVLVHRQSPREESGNSTPASSRGASGAVPISRRCWISSKGKLMKLMVRRGFPNRRLK